MTKAKTHTLQGRQVTLAVDGAILTVRIPITLSRHGVRKAVIVPEGATAWRPPQPARTANALITSLARAHRWKSMMESGDYASTADLAKAEGINFSYLCRVLRLTLLSPKIIETILNNQAADLELKDLMQPFPVEWVQQEMSLQPLRA